jgi:Rrf2 family protein
VAAPTNTQFALAVHMLTLLGLGPDALQRSEELAGSAGVSPVHVRRVLGRLRRAGLVDSRNGPGGGWHVVQPVCDITLDVVWHALHGDEPVLGLYDANPDCTIGQSVQAELLALDRRAARALSEELGRTTIGELVDRARAATPPAPVAV